ncbi:MAG: hypothetical protein ACE5I5_11485 [Candidatus Heimdallarchaeota archaeon]
MVVSIHYITESGSCADSVLDGQPGSQDGGSGSGFYLRYGINKKLKSG